MTHIPLRPNTISIRMLTDAGTSGAAAGLPSGAADAPAEVTYTGTWSLTVRRLATDGGRVPSLIAAPSLTGEPRIGNSLETSEGTWDGSPEPTFTYAWTRNGAEIPDAHGRTYTLVPSDDGASLACRVTASNMAGSTVATTESVRVLYAPPLATTSLLEEVFDQAAGSQVLETALFFQGENLTFTASGSGASIDAATGRLTLATDVAVSAREVTVTAANSGGSASLLVLVTVEAAELPPADEEDGPARLGFVAPTVVHLIVEEGSLTEYDREVATGARTFARGMDPTFEAGGAGTLDGTAGNFSGDRNIRSPQLFERWPVADGDAWSPAFAISNRTTNTCPADTPGNWTVTVNGAARAVTATHRKTVPVKTRMVGVGQTRRSVRRHTVALTLGAPLSRNDEIRVVPPSGAPAIEGTFLDSAVSEAIHVCQEGYASATPKKGYVGLWLGHDGSGSSGTTNGLLSDATPWRLIAADDGAVVASGRLAMTKRQTEAHQDDLNYNGCDIYEADFSSYEGEGRFRLEIPGLGSSPTFSIAADPYAESLRLAARAYYYQRSGCAITAEHGEGITRPRNGHPDDGLIVWQSRVKLGRTHEGFGSADPFAPLRLTPKGEGAASSGAEIFPSNPSSAIAWQGSSILMSGSTITWPSNDWAEISFSLMAPTKVGKTYRVAIDAVRPTTGGTFQWKFGAGWPVGASQPQTIADGRNVYTFTSDSDYTRFEIAGQRPWNGENLSIRSVSIVEATEGTGSPAGQANPNAWGGWHDAGDFDRRIQHMETVYLMAELVESCPVVRSLDLNIPESGKPFADAAVEARKNADDRGDGSRVLPDLIHEALWGISLWRRTQRQDGAILGGVEYSLEAIQGSVSWNPLMDTYAYDFEEWAAYKFAMAAAKLGHVVKTVCGDRVLGDALIAEAVAAWNWAESVFATGIDTANGSGGDPFSAAERVRLDRMRAAPVVYRAAGTASARQVWESYNSFAAQSGTGLPKAGEWIGWHPYDYTFQALDYRRAGLEARPVNASISNAIQTWSSDLRQVVGTPIGTDYGLQSNDMYRFGAGWFRFGPGSNWMAARFAVTAIAGGSITPAQRDAIVQGMWFALGCNPSNVSLIHGLGRRQFGQHLLIDFTYPGAIAVGPAAGNLRSWERDFVGDSLYPRDDTVWPRYARIFESAGAVVSSEFDVKANMMEWLFGCAMAAQALRA